MSDKKKKELIRLKTELVKTLLSQASLQPLLHAARSYRLRQPFTKSERMQPYRCPHCRMQGIETFFRFRPEFLTHLKTHG